MANPGPWSVKGIDDETRNLARDAAARAGLPIGAWIDRAILKAAGHGVTCTALRAGNPTDDATASDASFVGATVPLTQAPTDVALQIPAILPSSPPEQQVSVTSPPPAAIAPAPQSDTENLPAIPTRRRTGRGETFIYASVGVAVLLAVLLGANVIDSVALPPHGETSQLVQAETPSAQPARADAAPQADEVAPERPDAAAVAKLSEPPADELREPASRIQQLERQATTGDAAAQHELALLYSAGVDVAKDEKRAAALFAKAAEQGFAPSQYNLGVVYEQGLGVEKNAETAFTWYKRAAEQGYGRAQHNLGTLYAVGNGTAQNYEEAARLFSRAVESGVPESLYSLGLMHEHGLGVARDESVARSYYQRASDAGVAEAARKLASLPKQPEPKAAAATPAADVDVAPAAGATGSGGSGAPDRPLDRKETAELQRLLQRLDFAPGTADGVVGRQTTGAIKLYQEFAGLPVDGKATRRLLEEIRQISGSLGHKPRTASR